MPFLTTAAGLRLHYLTWGAGAGVPVVLVHGITGCAALWEPVATILSHRGYYVVAPDLRGHGQSDRAVDYALEALAGDVTALILSLGRAPVNLVGHSLGGSVAWEVAAQRPDLIRRLIIEDQHPAADPHAAAGQAAWAADWPWQFDSREAGIDFLRRRGRSVEWWAPSLLPLPRTAAAAGAVTAELSGGWDWGFDRTAVIETMRRLHAVDRWERLTQVQAPTLLIHGAQSTHLSPDAAARMVALLPRGRLLTLPGDHWVHRDPLPYAAAVDDFLRTDTPSFPIG